MRARPAELSRTVAGVGLLASAVLLVAWSLLSLGFEFPADPAARLAEAADKRDRMVAAALVFALLQTAFLPAVLGLVHLSREASFVLASLGGGLAILGVIGHLVFAGSGIAAIGIAEQGTGNELVAAFERADRHPALLPFMALGAAGTFLGFLLLAAALWRSRAVPWQPAALLVAGFLLEFVGSAAHELIGLAGALAAGAAFLWLGLRILRMPVDAWRNPALREQTSP